MSNVILLISVLLACANATKYMYPHSILYEPYPGLPPLPFPALKYLCEGKEGTIYFLPWDCTGYLRCYHNNAYWTSCPFDSRSVGIMKEPVCIQERAKCQLKEAGRWKEFCRQTGRIPYPSSSNCAAYHDCSVGQEGVVKECPYLELFNAETRLCEDFRTAEALCGSRYIPKAPCEYNENLSCGSSPYCLPCEERWPSCVGLSDGYHEIRKDYEWFLKCERERTVGFQKCPDGQVFTSTCGCTNSSADQC